MSAQGAVAARLTRGVTVRLLLGAVLLVVAGLAVAVPVSDTFADLILGVGDHAARLFSGFGQVTWTWIPALFAIAGIHYALAAVALRAASGLPLALPEAVLAQLAAAAANRLTPLGLGGAAVNARYLTRRGLPPAGAMGSVGALQILGPITDCIVVLAVLFAVPGAINETLHIVGGVGVSARHVAELVLRFAAVGLVAIAAILVLLWLRHHRHAMCPPPPRRWLQRVAAHGLDQVGILLHRPRDLAVAAVSSASTTLILGVGFVLSALATGAVHDGANAALVFSTFLAASAVASAIPLPAAAGSTEAALLGVLLTDHVPAVHAIPAVLLFRAVTFWAPAPVGLVAAGVLRRRRIL